jgi:hypothetical protein
MSHALLDGVEIVRFGLKYSPPLLVVEYRIAGGRTVMRKISFRKYRGKTPSQVADALLRKCEDILGPEHARTVSEEQVRDLVALLLTSDQGAGQEKEEMPERTVLEEADVFGDLNTVSEEENARAKEIMSERFEKNRLQPGDAGYVYDRRVEFSGPTVAADWDDEDDDEDEEEE